MTAEVTDMTSIVLKNPTPKERRYAISDISELIWEHETEWKKQIPHIARLRHDRKGSEVGYLVWNWYLGCEDVELLVRPYNRCHVSHHINAQDLEAMGRILGIERCNPAYKGAR